MTILGVHVVDRERAFVWVDSETFVGTSPHDHRSKLCVNVMALAVGAGRGWGDLADEGRRTIMMAATFDEAVDALPDRLRKASVKFEPAHRGPLHPPFCGNVFLAAGWSRRDGRVMAYTFSAYDFFAPTIAGSHATPFVDLEPFRPNHPADMLPIARRQMTALREDYPDATGGALCVAELRPTWIAALPLYDFAAGWAMPPADAAESGLRCAGEGQHAIPGAIGLRVVERNAA